MGAPIDKWRLFDRVFERRAIGAFQRSLKKSPIEWKKHVDHRCRSLFKHWSMVVLWVLMAGVLCFAFSQDADFLMSPAIKLIGHWLAWIMTLMCRVCWLRCSSNQVWAERIPIDLRDLQSHTIRRLGWLVCFFAGVIAYGSMCFLMASLSFFETVLTGLLIGAVFVVGMVGPGLLWQAWASGRPGESMPSIELPDEVGEGAGMGRLTLWGVLVIGPAILLASPSGLGLREGMVAVIEWLPIDWALQVLFDSHRESKLVTDPRLWLLLPILTTVPFSIRQICQNTGYDDWVPSDVLHACFDSEDEGCDFNRPPARPGDLTEVELREDLEKQAQPSPRWNETGWLEKLICRLSSQRDLIGLELAYQDSPGWTRRYTRTCWIAAICVLVAWIGAGVTWPILGLSFVLIGQISLAFLVIRACLCAVRIGGPADGFRRGRLPGSITRQFDLGLKVAYLRLLTAAPVSLLFFWGMRQVQPHENPIALTRPEHLLAALFLVPVVPVFWLGQQIEEKIGAGWRLGLMVSAVVLSLVAAVFLGLWLIDNHSKQSLMIIVTGVVGGLGWCWYLALRLICRCWK